MKFANDKQHTKKARQEARDQVRADKKSAREAASNNEWRKG